MSTKSTEERLTSLERDVALLAKAFAEQRGVAERAHAAIDRALPAVERVQESSALLQSLVEQVVGDVLAAMIHPEEPE